MGSLFRKRTETVERLDYVGMKCEKCGALHRYDPPPDTPAIVHLTPLAKGWVSLVTGGTNQHWNFCGACWPSVLSFIGEGGPRSNVVFEDGD